MHSPSCLDSFPDASLPAAIHRGTPAFVRISLALFAAGVATFGLLYCVQPLMPALGQAFGVGAARSALPLSLTTGVLACAMLLTGALSDRWGRKPVMAVALLLSALLGLGCALAHAWSLLLILRALLGLSLSGVPAVAMTYLAEELHTDAIGLGMGLYIAGSAVGGMAGRLLASVAADLYGWRAGIASVGVLALVAALAFVRLLPDARRFRAVPVHPRALAQRFAGAFRDAGLPWLFVEGFLLLGSFVTVYNYAAYRLMGAPYHLSQSAVGLVFGVYLVGTLSSTWMGALAGRLGRRKVLWTTLATMLAGIVLTLASPLACVVLGIALVTFGFFGGHSIASSWVGRRAGGAKVQAASLYLFCYYLGSSVCGLAGGVFYSACGWIGVGAFVAALLLVALAIAWRLRGLPPLPGPPSPGTEPALPQ